jgi:hypothetical protein
VAAGRAVRLRFLFRDATIFAVGALAPDRAHQAKV